jgi:hypothetical protein
MSADPNTAPSPSILPAPVRVRVAVSIDRAGRPWIGLSHRREDYDDAGPFRHYWLNADIPQEGEPVASITNAE